MSGTKIKLTISQKSKLRFALDICSNGGDIGSWIDPSIQGENHLPSKNISKSQLSRAKSKNMRGSKK